MTDQEKYEAFLAGLQLRHFSPQEITRYGAATRSGERNGLPEDPELWENLVPPLWVVDQLRESINLPIRLTSLWRSPAYNKAVGGSSGSFHMKNSAIDFQVDGMSPLQAFNRLNKMRHAGCFTGGLGLYSTFVHIDAGLRGRNATW
jgi:uncharacterized protein YcbK (DUF882 family)